MINVRGWRSGRIALLSVVSGLLIAAGLAMGRESGKQQTVRISPDWMQVDAAKQQVKLRIVAGLTTANSGWNFNGYANGDMTIAVPLDWGVEITFTTRDANYPHSVGVVEIQDPMPVTGQEATTVFRAFSVPFTNGIMPPKQQTFDFKVDRAGKFWLFCGVPTHGRGGMWDYFVVSDEISEPYVEVPKES